MVDIEEAILKALYDLRNPPTILNVLCGTLWSL